MVLSLLPTSWFYRKTHQNLVYQDQKTESLETQVGKIIYDMFVVANKLQVLDEVERREERRLEEERKRKRRLEQMRTGELEELKLLEQASSDWDRAQRIRRFADFMEIKVNWLDDEHKKEKLFNWLKWARSKADWIDLLMDCNDEMLGKSQSIFESILSLYDNTD